MTNERQQRAARAEQMRKEREKAEKKQRNFITVGIVVVVLALVAVGGFAVKSTSDDRKQVDEVITPKGANSDFGIPYTPKDAGGDVASGDPVKVVLYEDFQCPVCKSFEAANGQFLDDAVKSGEISIEYRIVSFLDRSSTNQYSSRAGSAALCAYEEGGGEAFEKVHDLLFANQPDEQTAGPENPALVDTLQQAGVENAKSCVLKGMYVPWLGKATQKFSADDIGGTPTVMIDGKRVAGAGGKDTVPQAPELRKAIEAAKKA